MEFNESFWQLKYQNNQTGWDAGSITTPLKEYIDQLINKNIKILIPGCGNGYEAEYLHSKGYDVTVVDVAEAPLQNLKKRCPGFPDNKLVHENFFNHTAQYDLILEQTFMSALPPKLRMNYVKHMYRLLSTNGKLVGVLFGIALNADHPPFGGTIEEYKHLFKNFFKSNVMAPCYNSITPRKGSEVFINLVKR